MDNIRSVAKSGGKNQQGSVFSNFIKIVDAAMLGVFGTTVMTDGLNIYIGGAVALVGGLFMGRMAYREIQREKINKIAES